MKSVYLTVHFYDKIFERPLIITKLVIVFGKEYLKKIIKPITLIKLY